MFEIDYRPIFLQRVTATMPLGRSTGEQDFTATFEALSVSEMSGFDLAEPEQVADFLRRVLVEASDIVDAHGNEVPFSPEIRDRLIDLPWTRRALVAGYFAGFARAAEKN